MSCAVISKAASAIKNAEASAFHHKYIIHVQALNFYSPRVFYLPLWKVERFIGWSGSNE